MYVYITISNAGTDVGPFNLYSNVDGYVSAFETNISLATLEAGFFTDNVPDGTLEIRVQSVNKLCTNYESIGINTLQYYFIPSDSQPGAQPNGRFTVDHINKGTYAYVYGAFKGYYNGSYEVPGNHLVKLNPDLSVETSFDIFEGFHDHLTYTGATMTELTNGSLIVVGFFTDFKGNNENYIIKLNTDGTKDTLFNTGNGFNNYTTGISESIDGKYYISGHYTTYDGASSTRIIRLLSDGSKDFSFNVGTGFDNTSISTSVNYDNSIFVSGYFSTYKGATANGIIKILSNGDIDPSFNAGTGFQPRGSYNGIIMARIPGDDGVYCAMYRSYQGAANYFLTYQGVNYGNIVKLNTDGTVDTSFNTGGTGFNGACGTIDVVFGDKLLITGGEPIFTSYNGTPTVNMILLYADGSILKTFDKEYDWPYTIGNKLYGTDVNTGLNQEIYEYVEITTTTTTTTI